MKPEKPRIEKLCPCDYSRINGIVTMCFVCSGSELCNVFTDENGKTRAESLSGNEETTEFMSNLLSNK